MLVLYEVGNTPAKHPSFGNEDSARAFQSLLDLTLKLRSFADSNLLQKSFEISRHLRITFYDASYVAVAKENETSMTGSNSIVTPTSWPRSNLRNCSPERLVKRDMAKVRKVPAGA